MNVALDVEKLAGMIQSRGTSAGDEAKRMLAEEFGRRHGWKRSRAWFCLGQLARQSNQRKDQEGFDEGRFHHMMLDHSYYYRETNRPYRPAAIAVHLYDWPADKLDIENICRRLGLRCEAVMDFPSWWYPGETHLIVYTPLKRGIS
jgi:hypothetical protein